MKKLIVTGGLGFIGSNLIDLLIQKKFKVINIDKVTYSSSFYNTKEFKNNKSYKFIKCDIKDKRIKDLLFLYKPDCIFNLAAETHVDRSIDDPENFIQSNIVGVYNLLENFKIFSQKYNSKLIHISTDEVYGDIKKGMFSLESDRYFPSSPYSSSKASADLLLFSYYRTFKLPIIITNCCNNYGPHQYKEKLIPKMIQSLKKNKNLNLYGNGTNEREWIYVTDHCKALIFLMTKGKIGEQYNIGSGKILNNKKIINKLKKIYNEMSPNNSISKIKFIKDRPGHDLRYALNYKKLKKIGWKPVMKLDEGLKKTISWYKEN